MWIFSQLSAITHIRFIRDTLHYINVFWSTDFLTRSTRRPQTPAEIVLFHRVKLQHVARLNTKTSRITVLTYHKQAKNQFKIPRSRYRSGLPLKSHWLFLGLCPAIFSKHQLTTILLYLRSRQSQENGVWMFWPPTCLHFLCPAVSCTEMQ